MRIRLLRNPARHLACGLVEGGEGEVADSLAEVLIENGIAVPVVVNVAKPIKAVPKKPEVTAVKESDEE